MTFNPSQPRAPAGTENGGQWVSLGTGNMPRAMLARDYLHASGQASAKLIRRGNRAHVVLPRSQLMRDGSTLVIHPAVGNALAIMQGKPSYPPSRSVLNAAQYKLATGVDRRMTHLGINSRTLYGRHSFGTRRASR